ncbi:hypothetical protein H9P43_006569 [Blastocladiella emersonii ATCC 22665]|nr:hypothetical protein H9P43_006569 [Blastocladiella emersonii ATCC 22665]
MERFQLTMASMLLIIFYWAAKIPVSTAAHPQWSDVSEKTIGKLYMKLREVCFHLYAAQEPLGGPGREVELDEAHFGHPKNQVGSRQGRSDIWVFGGIQRQLDHANFVDPESGSCTNKVEARWRTLKHHALPRGCTRKKYKHYYFAEHWFRLQHRGEDTFYAICNAIRDLWANGRPADPVFPFPFDVADGVPGNPDLADVSLSDDEDEDPLRAQDRELSYDSEPEAGTIEIDSDEEYLP